MFALYTIFLFCFFFFFLGEGGERVQLLHAPMVLRHNVLNHTHLHFLELDQQQLYRGLNRLHRCKSVNGREERRCIRILLKLVNRKNIKETQKVYEG